ncbi:hypothetical protein JZ751_021926 [Albula glossodonta]|uniref:Uncharacterized protein n=1 Tax=Albula glossodonta TaxID=121402 RepID=A0A8T2MTF3_9TELE|nr:hypothetical protein JZ751_021926 [Albula glossodonta]
MHLMHNPKAEGGAGRRTPRLSRSPELLIHGGDQRRPSIMRHREEAQPPQVHLRLQRQPGDRHRRRSTGAELELQTEQSYTRGN